MSRWRNEEHDLYCDKCIGNGWAAPEPACRYLANGEPTTAAEALAIARSHGWIVAEDAGSSGFDICPRCQSGERGPWYDEDRAAAVREAAS